MALKIHGLSLSSISLPQALKQPHRLTILFGAVFLVGIALFTARSLSHRAHVSSPQPAEDPNKAIRSLYESGLKNLKENKTAQAEIDFTQALDSYNSKLSINTYDPLLSGQIYYQLGVCHERKGDFQKARDNYDSALSLTKDRTIHAEISLKKGMLIQNNDLEGSTVIYDHVIEVTHRKGQTPDPKLYTIACLLKSHALLRKEQSTEKQRNEAAQDALDYAESAGTSAKESKDFHFVTEALYQQGLCNRLLGGYNLPGYYNEALKKYEMALYLVENLYIKACILYERALMAERFSYFGDAVKYYKEALECKFTDEHFLESSQFRGPFKKGAPASFENLDEFKATIVG